MKYHIKQTEQKALEINLDPSIYGTFAEIGAGQEVARNFFQAGAAAGTIAKTMSAYDKKYSDVIYGEEPSGRYVCESRLYRMLDHEYDLILERLDEVRTDCRFFAFADTVSAINYQKTIKGNGWLGLRFRLSPDSEANDLVIHVKMLDNDNRLQQEAIGELGVNMLYASYFYHYDPEVMIKSLIDNLQGRVVIDMIRLTGPDFREVDNRLLSLFLVKHDLTEVAMFDKNRQSIHPSEFLYKKSLMVVRGHYRPPTLVTVDVLKSSYIQFKKEPNVDPEKCEMVVEMTLENLKNNGELDHTDFLQRVELLCELGVKVIISNCVNHQNLINYLSDYKIRNLGLVIGVRELLHIINEKYYLNQDGRLLVAFGELFTKDIRIYAYPALEEGSDKLMTSTNLPVPEGIKFLYKHLIDTKQIVEVEDFNSDLLHIFPHKIFEGITNGQDDWQNMLPARLSKIIEEGGYFGYKTKAVLSSQDQ